MAAQSSLESRTLQISRTPGLTVEGALGARRCTVRTGYGLRARMLDQSFEARIR